MQSKTKHEVFKVLDKYHQILLKENMKAAPDKSHFLLTRENLDIIFKPIQLLQ